MTTSGTFVFRNTGIAIPDDAWFRLVYSCEGNRHGSQKIRRADLMAVNEGAFNMPPTVINSMELAAGVKFAKFGRNADGNILMACQDVGATTLSVYTGD